MVTLDDVKREIAEAIAAEKEKKDWFIKEWIF